MWPIPLFIGVYLAPESPWWLVRRGRLEDAKTNLLRLTSKNRETDFDADETLAMMQFTTKLEEKVRRSSRPAAQTSGTDAFSLVIADHVRSVVLGLLPRK